LAQAYPDLIGDDANNSRWDAALAVASMLKDIPTLPLVLAGPLAQIADVMSGTIDSLKLMRDNREECIHLVDRVVKFLQALIADLKMSNMPIADGTPTAARLFALRR
jgi:hypothetical protein